MRTETGIDAKKERRSFLIFGLAGLLLLGWFALVDPTELSLFPPCLFHRLTGWDCPGCGGQRAVHALLTGRVSESFAFNPLVILGVVPLGVYLGASALLRALGRKGFPPVQLGIPVLTAFVLLGALFVLWRNLAGQ